MAAHDSFPGPRRGSPAVSCVQGHAGQAGALRPPKSRAVDPLKPVSLVLRPSWLTLGLGPPGVGAEVAPSAEKLGGGWAGPP